MLVRLKSLCGQYLRLLLYLSVYSGLAITLTGCGKGPLSLLTGGGPNVAAQVQMGKENNQAVVSQTTRTEAGRDVNQAQVQADEVKEVTIQEVPPWVVLLLILGWLLPSPNEIGRWITNLFRPKGRRN